MKFEIQVDLQVKEYIHIFFLFLNYFIFFRLLTNCQEITPHYYKPILLKMKNKLINHENSQASSNNSCIIYGPKTVGKSYTLSLACYTLRTKEIMQNIRNFSPLIFFLH
jgi:hypothetical protein